jgi:carbon-monoxide dehydrogenase medium subunit
MTPFELLEPTTLQDAIALIEPGDAETRPIAGGTALMLMMKAGVFQPRRLVSLRKLNDGFTRIEATTDRDVKIGAMASLSAIEHSPVIAKHLPVIVRTMRRLANVRVRNVATIGGALAHADPHMDLPPVLIALDASVSIAGTSGERTILVEDLLTGYYETALEKGEIITQVRIPAQGAASAVYFKVTAGSADDWPALGVAVAIESEGKRIKSARIVVSAATNKATRLKKAELALVGADASDKTLAIVAETAIGETEVIADLRGSASYKRELLRVYTTRAVQAAIQANGAPR